MKFEVKRPSPFQPEGSPPKHQDNPSDTPRLRNQRTVSTAHPPASPILCTSGLVTPIGVLFVPLFCHSFCIS